MATPSVVRSTAAVRSSWAGSAPRRRATTDRTGASTRRRPARGRRRSRAPASSSSRSPRRTRASSAADVASELLVVAEEGVRGVPLAVDQGVADEHLAGERRVDAVVADGAAGHDRQAVQRHRLGDDGAPAALVPARLAVRPLHQVGAEALGPLRLHRGDTAGPQAVGLDQLGGHHPPRRLLGQHRPGAITNVAAAGAAERDRPAPGSRRRSSRSPRCDSSPASTAWWTWSGWPATPLTRMPSDRRRPGGAG